MVGGASGCSRLFAGGGRMREAAPHSARGRNAGKGRTLLPAKRPVQTLTWEGVVFRLLQCEARDSRKASPVLLQKLTQHGPMAARLILAVTPHCEIRRARHCGQQVEEA